MYWGCCFLACLFGLTAAGIDPSFLHSPWAAFSQALQLGHPLYLALIGLVLCLAGLPLEYKLGPSTLLATWGLPSLSQYFLYHRCWPELAAAALVSCTWLVAQRRGEALLRNIWVPLLLTLALSLWISAPPWGALAVSLAWGLFLGRMAPAEWISIAGLASGGAFLLAWLS